MDWGTHAASTEEKRQALGLSPAGRVFKNARVLNVFTGEIVPGDIAVSGGRIVGVGDYAGREETDLEGRTVVPGFVDAHLHLESTLVTPPQLIDAAAAEGTTVFIVDPHEAVNVAGEAGLDFLLEQTENVRAHVFVMLPSCVPSAPGEDNGCTFTAERMAPYRSHPRVLGLGEVMDCEAVLRGDPGMEKKLALFAGMPRDGHAAGLNGRELTAYALAGISSDHEATTFEFAREELRRGMQVLVREGSAARNLDAIIGGVLAAGLDTRGLSFCTDDKHIDDIRREGHISHNIRRSIALGMDPVTAVQIATLNAARHYGLTRLGLGAVAPGYLADFVVLDDLENVKIHSVWVGGERRDGAPCPRPAVPENVRHTVHFRLPDERALALRVTGPAMPVVRVLEGQILTRREDRVLPARDGVFVPDGELNKCVVIERHRASGHIGKAPVAGFCLRGGAIASSVSHDSHNIVAIGDGDADIRCALEEVRRLQGGYVLTVGGEVWGRVPLPLLGLMSDADFAAVERELHRMVAKAHEMGVPAGVEPFITLSFLALTAIPEIRVTTHGLWIAPSIR